MSTINWNMTTSKVDAKKAMHHLGLAPIDLSLLDTIALADSRKLDRIGKAPLRKSILIALARTGEGNTARIAPITNWIERLGKLNAGVLSGGSLLKQQLIDLLWQVYSILEIQGVDDAHYTDSHIPCSKEDKIVSNVDKCHGFMFYQPSKKTKLVFPDSCLSTDDQYLALSLVEKFRVTGVRS